MLARFREFQAARRTIQGYEAIHMIRKGQARWVAGGDLLRQIQFIDSLFWVGSLRTHDRRSATNLSAFETCNTTNVGTLPAYLASPDDGAHLAWCQQGA